MSQIDPRTHSRECHISPRATPPCKTAKRVILNSALPYINVGAQFRATLSITRV